MKDVANVKNPFSAKIEVRMAETFQAPATEYLESHAKTKKRSWKEDERMIEHDLRRTTATHMTSAGIPRLTVKRILNHLEGDLTGIYGRYSNDP